MINRAVQKAVEDYFDRTQSTQANALDIWTSTNDDQYDGNPWQFAECLYELPGIGVEPQWADDPTNDPIVYRA